MHSRHVCVAHFHHSICYEDAQVVPFGDPDGRSFTDHDIRRGMATYMGKDVSKLKAKGGKWKYMSEKEMLDIAAKFSPYR